MAQDESKIEIVKDLAVIAMIVEIYNDIDDESMEDIINVRDVLQAKLNGYEISAEELIADLVAKHLN